MASKSLYVGNLPHDTTEQELRQLFEVWGPVAETRLIAGRGFGFVEVPDEKAADAIAAMNGKDHKGRALVVNEARPRTPQRSGGGYGRDRDYGDRGGYGRDSGPGGRGGYGGRGGKRTGGGRGGRGHR